MNLDSQVNSKQWCAKPAGLTRTRPSPFRLGRLIKLEVVEPTRLESCLFKTTCIEPMAFNSQSPPKIDSFTQNRSQNCPVNSKYIRTMQGWADCHMTQPG